mgnify:CR=1 FL=1
MSDEMMLNLWWLSFLGGLALLCFVIFKTMDFIYNQKDKKHHKEHPEFFRLRDDYIAKADRACNFHNKTIVSYKRKIDSMMKEADYLPQEAINRHKEKIEELRSQLFAARSVEKSYDNMAEEARKKVVEYVHANNIKWAGVWE